MFGKVENKYDFRKRLETATKLKIDNSLSLTKDEISLSGGVEFIGDTGSCLELAKKDFINFLGSPKGGKKVKIEIIKDDAKLGKYAEYKGRIITVSDDKIIINAFDDRGAAQAIYDLEKTLSARRAPFVKKGEYKNKPLFSPRMIHSAYGLEEYPKGYMHNLVKEGIDAIVVFVKDINTTQVGYLDFNALIKTANAMGLDVYAYCMLNGFNHPADENAEEIFDGIYYRFFSAHPGFKGLVLVGESVEFPSKDPAVTPRHYYEIGTEDNIPEGKPSPGWWPCKDYPDWVSLVAKSVRKARPDADIVFWTYNWGYAPKEDRIALINALPTNITLQVTFEMFEKYPYGDTDMMVMDYSIASPGPGKYFLSEAEAAKKRGIKLYTMCNAGGRTWDMGVVPFVPATELWKERYKALVECHERYGLDGTMECHHFGFTPSVMTRFAEYCFADNGLNEDECLDLALSDYFGDNANEVKRELAKFSDAMRTFPPSDEMQYGPMRISTAYPLNLIKVLQPIEKQNVSFGLRICLLDYTPWDFGRYSPHCLRVKSELKEMRNLKKTTDGVIKTLSAIKDKNDYLKRLINMFKFISCSFETAINAFEFFRWKLKLKIADNRQKLNVAIANIKRIANKEIANAKKSIAFVEKDSALGFEPSMGYACDKERIEWKIKQVNYMLEKELALYEEK